MMVEIRKARYEDCEAFVQWENDEEVIKYLSIPRGKTLEMTIREFIQRESDDSVMDFGVYYQDKIIGRAFLSRYDRVSHSIDITRIYLGDSSNRGKGLGTDMMKLLMHYCFENLNLNRVTLDYLDGNPAQKIYRNLGFVDEGIARVAGFKDGVYHNYNLMSMLKKEYRALYPGL